MRTKDELIDLIAKKLHFAMGVEVTMPDFVSEFNSMSPEEKTDFVEKAISGEAKVSNIISSLSQRIVGSKAKAKATQMLANDTISLAELDLIL